MGFFSELMDDILMAVNKRVCEETGFERRKETAPASATDIFTALGLRRRPASARAARSLRTGTPPQAIDVSGPLCPVEQARPDHGIVPL